jgi:hypothetical protein
MKEKKRKKKGCTPKARVLLGESLKEQHCSSDQQHLRKDIRVVPMSSALLDSLVQQREKIFHFNGGFR